ncbi:unnamed protein product [Cyprideis torosa]|uniref:Uncharacterized protein n=1 Tax=Cyprideis torosa TaxID=163714 RepID=A0A7R8WBU9_9CRUS|nr:unnamed protein product [Cyprideis torosa]CAG0891284.1 unnamed protein product [Cyprideis torosa]
MAVSPSLKVFFLTLCSAVVLCVPTVDPLEELKRRSAAGPVDWTDGRTGYVAETRTGSSSPCGPNFECVDESDCEKEEEFDAIMPKFGFSENFTLTECSLGLDVKGVCCNFKPPSQECEENEVCELEKCPIQRNQELSDLRDFRKTCVFSLHLQQPAVCCDKTTDLFDPVPLVCGVRNSDGVVSKGKIPLGNIFEAFSTRITSRNTSFASFGEYPWQAMLFVKNADTGAYDFEGGGVLISTRHVLTAAHEVDGVTVDTIQVRLGEWMMADAREPMEHQDYYVDDVQIHPSYRSRGFFNDLAVLTLKKEVFITNNVHVVCLPQKGESFVGQRCVSTGWGAETFDGSTSNTLKEVELPLISHDECQQIFRQIIRPTFPLHENFICAGGEGEDTCQGDGGGPLVCEKEVGPGLGPVWVLAGITSWGVRGKCGVVGVPGAYAAVEPALDWINEHHSNKFLAVERVAPAAAEDSAARVGRPLTLTTFDSDGPWIGGIEVSDSGLFEWASDGSPIDTTYWAPGQPDSVTARDGIQLTCSSEYRWADEANNSLRPFICEAPHVPPPLQCPSPFFAIGERCYHIPHEYTYWETAQSRCQSLDAHAKLAEFETSTEIILVTDYLQRNDPYCNHTWWDQPKDASRILYLCETDPLPASRSETEAPYEG